MVKIEDNDEDEAEAEAVVKEKKNVAVSQRIVIVPPSRRKTRKKRLGACQRRPSITRPSAGIS